jgi:hypothetical protein
MYNILNLEEKVKIKSIFKRTFIKSLDIWIANRQRILELVELIRKKQSNTKERLALKRPSLSSKTI